MFVFPAIPATKETWRRWGLPRFGMPATPTRDLQLLYLHATSTIEMGWRLARETLVENRWPGMILPCRIPVRKSPVRKACDDHHLVKFFWQSLRHTSIRDGCPNSRPQEEIWVAALVCCKCHDTPTSDKADSVEEEQDLRDKHSFR